jgi:prevent-host-death family protein
VVISATYAARHLGAVLDAVERNDQAFTVTRRGRAVAQIVPAGRVSGRSAKDVLNRHHKDDAWSRDVALTRSMLVSIDRSGGAE